MFIYQYLNTKAQKRLYSANALQIFILFTEYEFSSGLPVALERQSHDTVSVEILSNAAQQYEKLYLKMITTGD